MCAGKQGRLDVTGGGEKERGQRSRVAKYEKF